MNQFVKRVFVSLSILCLCLTAFWSCSSVPAKPVWESQFDDGWRARTSESEAACLRFMTSRMVGPDGGIRTNYKDMPKDIQLATGSEVLSESQGLMMHYALLAHDAPLFDQCLGYINDILCHDEIIAYRYAPDQGAYTVNALVDDLRIIHALLLAEETFHDESYGVLASQYADRLYQTNVLNGKWLADFYDTEYAVQNDFITLCYIDLQTLGLLEAQDFRWARVIRTMTGIIRRGYISDDFPMYAASYSYTEKSYRTESINMTEACLTVLNLARIGECPESTHRFLKQLVTDGPVYGRYYPDGSPADRVESTAIYAILAQAARELNDAEMYKACIVRMLAFQVLDETSEVYGAFADPDTLDLYAFDNLNALLALGGD